MEAMSQGSVFYIRVFALIGLFVSIDSRYQLYEFVDCESIESFERNCGA